MNTNQMIEVLEQWRASNAAELYYVMDSLVHSKKKNRFNKAIKKELRIIVDIDKKISELLSVLRESLK